MPFEFFTVTYLTRIGNQVAFTDREGIIHPAHSTTFVAGVSGMSGSSNGMKCSFRVDREDMLPPPRHAS
jgi:hypothetical protein